MSAIKPITVDEAIEKLQVLSQNGRGDSLLVYSRDAYVGFQTLHGFEKCSAVFESLEPSYPKNQTQTYYGERAMPSSHSQKVVRIY